MRYLIHPKGRPQAAQWVSAEQYAKIKAHYHGKGMVIAQTDDTPTAFAHPRPILPAEAKPKSIQPKDVAPSEQPAKATTEASPEPRKKKGESNGA